MKSVFLFLLIAVAAATRLVPHPPNVAAIVALGLFAGYHVRGRWAWALPVAAVGLSDVVGHFCNLPGMG
ncbi:MAG: DUF6580 family putative transport protein, partial [Planctomycetota bacterium]